MEGLDGVDLEALDPSPDVHALFAHYNALYFDNQLGACSVEWSTKRMTLCAGVCHFSRTGGCRIKLSEPLLKFRPIRDLKDTLLHEMIHAALFLGNVRDDGDHGPRFRAIMQRINTATCMDPQRPPGGYNITVFHTMHDEVNNYRTHVWRCTVCGNEVRRSMNRPPQEADCRGYSKAAAAAAPGGAYCRDARCWYHGHLRACGGVYEKIAEPTKPDAKPGGTEGPRGQPSSSTANRRRQGLTAAAGAPAITTFFAKRENKQQQQQQQQQAVEPSHGLTSSSRQQQVPPPDNPRAAAAAAAMARAGSSSTHQSVRQVHPVQPTRKQQQLHLSHRELQGALSAPPTAEDPQQQQRQKGRLKAGEQPVQPAAPAVVVDLLSSDSEGDEDDSSAVPSGRVVGGVQQQLPSSAPAASGPSGATSFGGAVRSAGVTGGVSAAPGAAALLCPVCCIELRDLAELNQHLDQCLL